MVRLSTPARLLAVCLAAVAGYVDALGYLALGGFFVSFMSGNSTRLGIGLDGDRHQALLAGGLILTFVLGAALGSAIGRSAASRRAMTVLASVAFLLFIAASLASVGIGGGAIVAMVLAMGVENAVFQEGGEVRVGLTYMTGALVKLGQKLAAVAMGGDRLAWIPDLMLWVGLVAGAAVGAWTYARIGLAGLWAAAAIVAALAVAAARPNAQAPDRGR